MPLFRVTFTEENGYRLSVRLRAGTTAPLVTLAVRKVWGEDARWIRTPGEAQQGLVFRVSPHADEDALHPLTGVLTVTVEPVAGGRGAARAALLQWD
jgi:hypothetical protein